MSKDYIMVLSPFPAEHIYSYLYRCYRVHGVQDAMNTIINADGLFRQRLGFIKYDYIQSFVPEIPDYLEYMNPIQLPEKERL